MSPARMAKVESAIRLALAFRDALNRQDVKAMMLLLNEECVFEPHDAAPHAKPLHGKEAVEGYWQNFFNTAQQPRLDIDEIFGFGERCIMRWKLEFTDHSKEVHSLRGIHVYKTEKELILEILSYIKSQPFVE